MKKAIVAMVVLGLLPIPSAPANAKVCTYKSRQVKDTTNQAYTKYMYVTKRVCR